MPELQDGEQGPGHRLRPPRDMGVQPEPGLRAGAATCQRETLHLGPLMSPEAGVQTGPGPFQHDLKCRGKAHPAGAWEGTGTALREPVGSQVGCTEQAALRNDPWRSDRHVQSVRSPIVQTVLSKLPSDVANHHPWHGKKGLRVPNLHRPQMATLMTTRKSR